MAGQKSLNGQILGLFLVHADRELTLDEITRDLGVSKGPVSQSVRELSEQRLLQKIWKKGRRRHYYRLAENFWPRTIQRLLEPLHHRLKLAQELLALPHQQPFGEAFWQQMESMQNTYVPFLESAVRALEASRSFALPAETAGR